MDAGGGTHRWCDFSVLNSPHLSTPIETRQTRQLASKPLTSKGQCVSGTLKNPTLNPTFRSLKPDKSGQLLRFWLKASGLCGLGDRKAMGFGAAK